MNPDLNNLSLAELQERVNAACPLVADATAPNTLSYWFQIGKSHARFEQSQLRRKVLFGWGGKAKPLLAVANRIEASEAEIIERSLRQHNYNQRATARTLKINRCTLIRRIKKYGIVMPLLLVLVSGCKTSSSVTPSETPVAVSRKPISGGIPPLPAASFQKIAHAATAPPAQKFLTWDSAENRARVYVGPARNILTNSFLIAGNSFPIEPGLHYAVATVNAAGVESSLAYWPSNRLGVLIEQTSTDLQDWKDERTLETFTNAPTRPRMFLRVVDRTTGWD